MLDLSINEKFAEARLRVLGDMTESEGFGRLAEKSLHKILKLYIEPDESCHEIKYLGSIVDVKNSFGITEIQTRAFSRLIPKLGKFLEASPVTVVYPLHYTKSIRWIDASSGEMTPPRRSPKHDTPFSACYELYNIREFLISQRLSVKLMFLNSEEYRMKGVRVKVGRRYRSTERIECIPNSIEYTATLKTPEDYRIFIPEGLKTKFTAADFNRAVGGNYKRGYSAIQILKAVGLVSDGEKDGRCVYYTLL